MDNKNFLDKAQLLSNLLVNNSNEKNNYNLDKILQMFKSINSLDKNQEIEHNKNNLFPKISFENPNIKKIKSVLPFIDIEHQKNIGTFIEAMEVNHILNEYNTAKKNTNIEKNKIKKEFILAIKPHLKDNNKDLLDLMFKIIEINEITNKITLRKEE